MTLTEGIYMYHGNKGGSDDRHIMPMSTLLIRNNNSKHCTFLGLVTNKRWHGANLHDDDIFSNIYEHTIDKTYVQNGYSYGDQITRYTKEEIPEYHGVGSAGNVRSAHERLPEIQMTYGHGFRGIMPII